MALPRGTTGSLAPTFVSARPVGLAVRQACALALTAAGFRPPGAHHRAPPFLLGRRPPQSNYPPCRVPEPASRLAVRHATRQGWYFKVASTGPGGPASMAPTYPTHVPSRASAKL